MNQSIEAADNDNPLSEEVQDLRREIGEARECIENLTEGAIVEGTAAKRHAMELVEANAHLVVSALRAQTHADDATRELDLVSRSAEIDGLTGLPNRQALASRFTYAIAIAQRTGTQLALLFIDLDDFKQINDSMGHAVGDQILRLTAKRLVTAVRESDTVSRHGGDEFVILVTDVSHAIDVERIAIKLLAALARPARIGEHVLRLNASIGISLYPADGEDAATLIEHADAAMYQAKRRGPGGFAFYANAETSGVEPATPLFSARYYPLGHHGTALAAHEGRHAQLREANEKLVLTALDAQQQKKAAEQALQRHMDLLAAFARELQTPLLPMQHAATLLHRARADSSLLPHIQDTIERQLAHLARLVGNLLDVSRIGSGSGRLGLECRMIDAAQVINEAVAASRPAIDARQQHFTVHIMDGPWDLYGDPIRLAQIFGHLLDNASRYTRKAGDIDLSVVRAEDRMVITVSDTGIGMTAPLLSRLFEPFVRDPAAVELNATGLGLGLAFVRELVAAHGGTFSASSAGPGLGSQFTVTLPLGGGGPQSFHAMTLHGDPKDRTNMLHHVGGIPLPSAIDFLQHAAIGIDEYSQGQPRCAQYFFDRQFRIDELTGGRVGGF